MKIPKLNSGYIYGLLASATFAVYVLINRYIYLNYHVDGLKYTITFAVAGGVFALFGALHNNIKGDTKIPFNKSLLPVIFNGILAGIALGVFVFGQSYTSAANASILATTTMATTAAFSWFLIKGDRFDKRQLAWFGCMFVGLYLAIVGLHTLSVSKGDLIILASCILLGFVNVNSKLLMKNHSSKVVTDVRLISGALFLAIVGMTLYGTGFLITNAGLLPLLAGFFFWLTIRFFYAAVDHINPSRAIILANMHSAVTPIIGALLLAEPYGPLKFIGGVLIIVSVININSKKSLKE